MMIIKDEKYRYMSAFDPDTGRGIRSNVYDSDGKDTGLDPVSYTHLVPFFQFFNSRVVSLDVTHGILLSLIHI